MHQSFCLIELPLQFWHLGVSLSSRITKNFASLIKSLIVNMDHLDGLYRLHPKTFYQFTNLQSRDLFGFVSGPSKLFP